MTVELHGLPDPVSVAVGEQAVVPLPSYAGAGLDWSATAVSGAEVADVRVEIGSLPETGRPDGTSEPPPMALAAESLVVAGRTEGTGVWHLRLARSFDPDHPAAELDLTVEVRPAG